MHDALIFESTSIQWMIQVIVCEEKKRLISDAIDLANA